MKNIFSVKTLKSPDHHSILYGFIFLIVVFWVSIFTLSQSFQGFHLIDDHEILTFDNLLRQLGFWSTFQEWIKTELQGIRFRPLWILFKLLRIQLFQVNSSLWLSLNMLIAIITTGLWFLVGLTIGWSFLVSFGFTLMIVLGEQSAIYYRLGTPETLSVLLLALVFYFASLSAKLYFSYQAKILMCLQIFFTLLLILSKENFILVLPAIIFLKVSLIKEYHSLNFKKAFRAILPDLLINLLLFSISLGIIQYLKFSNQIIFSYADNFGFDSSRFLPTFNALLQKTPWLFILILLGALLYLSVYEKQILFKNLANPFILWILIVIPQLMIYAKSNIYERYLLPALIGYAFWIAFNLQLIGKYRRFLARLLSSAFIVSIIVSFFSVNYPQFQTYASQRIAISQLLTLVAEKTQKDDSILVVINPRSFFEFGLSLRKFLAYQFR